MTSYAQGVDAFSNTTAMGSPAVYTMV
jgi:hypothetical protein